MFQFACRSSIGFHAAAWPSRGVVQVSSRLQSRPSARLFAGHSDAQSKLGLQRVPLIAMPFGNKPGKVSPVKVDGTRGFRVSTVASAGFMGAVGKATATVAIIFGGICVLAYSLQRKLMYFPNIGPAAPENVGNLPPPYNSIEEHMVDTSDGLQLRAYYWPAPKPPTANYGGAQRSLDAKAQRRAATALLVFHGNAGTRADRLPWLRLLREGLGVAVAIIDYRGYGGNKGSPSEKGFAADAEAAAKWVRVRLTQDVASLPRVDEGQGQGQGQVDTSSSTAAATSLSPAVIYVGESIGTGVATTLAVKSPPEGMIMQCAFTSITDVAADVYPFLPVRQLLMDRYESLSRIHRVNAPIFFIHGDEDSIVPYSLGQQLYKAANEPKRFLTVPGADHNGIEWVDPHNYIKGLDEFLADYVDNRQ
eukprot:jgi/Mesvir1/28818/Mv18803-RA.1